MKNLVSFRELDSLGEGLVKDYAKKTHRWNSMCLDIEGFITDYLELRISICGMVFSKGRQRI